MKKKPKRGRPPTERGAYNPNPARQLGRVSDPEWRELRAACEAAGMSMVAWAVPTLLKKARDERGSV
jgi:alpha-beta hydrolase superfamily lysophospholipase